MNVVAMYVLHMPTQSWVGTCKACARTLATANRVRSRLIVAVYFEIPNASLEYLQAEGGWRLVS